MPTLNVSLTPQLAAFVDAELRAGRAATASEVVRRALDAARRERELHEAKLARLRAEIGVALAEAEAGEVVETTAVGLLAEIVAERGTGGRRA